MNSIFDQDFDTTCDFPASERQIDYVRSLRDQYENFRTKWAQITETEINPIQWGPLPTGRSQASEAIDKGKTAVAEMRARFHAARDAAQAETPEIGPGVYIVTVNDVSKLFLVRESQSSGYLYASTWNGSEWEYVSGAMNDIRRDGRPATLAEAQEFGRATGQCCKCGRTLTNPTSIEAGIGPICAGRF